MTRKAYDLKVYNLVEAALAVVEENRDFRAGMPAEWEGDPLQDAIERLAKAAEVCRR